LGSNTNQEAPHYGIFLTLLVRLPRYENFPQHPALNNLYLRIQRTSWQLYYNIFYESRKFVLESCSIFGGPELVSRPRGGLSWLQILWFSSVPPRMNQEFALNYTTSISFHVLSSSLFSIHPIIQRHTTGVITKHYATGVALQFDCKIIFR